MRHQRRSPRLLGAALATMATTIPLGGAQPPPAAVGGGGAAAAADPTTRAASLSLNFKDVPLDAVLEYLSEAAGFVVLKQGQIDARVTVISKQPVTPAQAVTVLTAALKGAGYSAVQEGRELKIIARDKAKKENIPVHFGADPANIEATDELITQVMPIANMDAVKLRQELAPLIGNDADVTATDSSNAIIVTDTSSNILRLARIISTLDARESSASDLRLVQLKYASASATAKLLTSIFKPEGQAAGGNPQQQQMMQMQQQQGGGAPRAPGGPRAFGGAVDKALRGGGVNAVADDRTNTLIITAPADTLKVIDRILAELDSNPVPDAELKTFRLKYADAETMSKTVASMFKGGDGQQERPFPFFFGQQPGGQQAAKVPVQATFDERTNSLIVSAPAEVLKRVGALVDELDADPQTASQLKTYQLKNSDAYMTAKLIDSLFTPPKEDQGGGIFRLIFLGGGQQQSSPRGPKVTTTSDDRTNTLIVTAPPEVLKVIDGIIAQLDANPTSDDSLFIYRLKNGQAENLEAVLNRLFGVSDGGQGGNRQQGQFGQQPGQFGQQQQQNQQGARSSLGRSSGNQAGGTGIGARRGTRNNGQGGNRGGGGANLPANLAHAATEMSGQVFVVADADTNSLIVTAASKYREQVRQIIEELDRPVPQVLIKVLVAEVTHTSSDDIGLDFSVLNQRPVSTTVNGTTTTTLKGSSGGTNLGNEAAAAANGGLTVSLLESNVTATLHALAVAGKLDVLSRPYILASDNQLASITVGQEVPFVTDTRLTDTGQQINTVQYQDVGIILNVTPHINPDGLVILDVTPEISQLTNSTVTISANVTAPIIDKRSADSRVGIRDGQTVVIGGLMEDQKTTTITKVPLLGDIPFLGVLFQRSQAAKTKTELLIFLTPHVAQEPDSLRPMSQDELRGTKLTPTAVAPGAFDDHLSGMRRGGGPDTQPADGAPTTRPRQIPHDILLGSPAR